MDIHCLPETRLQQAAHRLMSDPSSISSTISGRRLQVLSPGRINVHEGPDYLDCAILLDGTIIIGDAEFHKKSSDWKLHNHNSDPRYDNVILHVVLDDDLKDHNFLFETVILSESELEYAFSLGTMEGKEADINSIEELQHYALLRLLRKTAEAQKLIINKGIEEALIILVEDYVRKYNSRRRRPVYEQNKLSELIKKLPQSKALEFLNDLSFGYQIHIPDRLQFLIKTKFSGEGAHMRREIILNCILPLSLCLANEESRISLFLWYWSTPAINPYGILKRRFSGLPQNFLWQQQGMLEYMKDYGRKPNVVAETLRDYGFAEILSFYRLGRAPFGGLVEAEE